MFFRRRTAFDRDFGAAGVSAFIEVPDSNVDRLRNEGVRLYTLEQVQRRERSSRSNGLPSILRGQPLRFASMPSSSGPIQSGGRKKTRRLSKKGKTMKRKQSRK